MKSTYFNSQRRPTVDSKESPDFMTLRSQQDTRSLLKGINQDIKVKFLLLYTILSND